MQNILVQVHLSFIHKTAHHLIIFLAMFAWDFACCPLFLTPPAWYPNPARHACDSECGALFLTPPACLSYPAMYMTLTPCYPSFVAYRMIHLNLHTKDVTNTITINSSITMFTIFLTHGKTIELTITPLNITHFGFTVARRVSLIEQLKMCLKLVIS